MHQTDLFESLFKRKSTDTGTVALLEQLTKDHPYFSPAQFYLLQQTNEESPVHNRQSSRTAVFFDNPYWLNFQLTKTTQPIIQQKEETQKEMTPVLSESDNTDDASMMEEEIAPMKIELKIPALNKDEKNVDMVFEPMHLVDYFASQGIKLSEEVQTGDKLGKQLKSFTEWLKTMKKVHVAEPGQAGGLTAVSGEEGFVQTDTSIQSLAEKSNTEDEVLTEAMAEVLAKQGKTPKAMELYQKLSLLDPYKSAYFAAKIEQLKGI